MFDNRVVMVTGGGSGMGAASARLFGFNGFSLLLPQALAGLLSVAVCRTPRAGDHRRPRSLARDRGC